MKKKEGRAGWNDKENVGLVRVTKLLLYFI